MAEQECPGCRELKRRVAELEALIRDLQARLGLNSSDSSLPPAANPPQAGRQTTHGRQPGGQPGHEPQPRPRLPPERARHIVRHLPDVCRCCQAALPAAPGTDDPDPPGTRSPSCPRSWPSSPSTGATPAPARGAGSSPARHPVPPLRLAGLRVRLRGRVHGRHLPRARERPGPCAAWVSELYWRWQRDPLTVSSAESATTAGTVPSISYQPAAREMPPSAGSRGWRDGRGALRRMREIVA
jgi:hypothetical protein